MAKIVFEICEKCGKEDDKMETCEDCGCDSVCRFCSYCSYKKCREYKDE